MSRQSRGISVEMAWKLSKALGAAPNFWLNLQNNWELSRFDTSTVAKINRVPDLDCEYGNPTSDVKVLS